MGIHQYIIDGDPASLEQPDSTFEDGLAQQVLPPGLDLDNPLDRGPLELDDGLPNGFVATYDPKPLTVRSYDWEVIHEPTYDGAEDSPTRHQIGFGESRDAAVADLQAQLDDEEVAPLVVPEDGDVEDLRWQRGNDWLETDRLEDVYGVRSLFR